MNRLAASGLALLAALAAAAPAAAFTVALSKRDCGCEGGEGPQDKAGWEKADWRWRDDGSLEIQVWDTEHPGTDYIDVTRPLADLTGDELVLATTTRDIPPPADGMVMSCLSTVRLTFVISGLPRGRYVVQASRARRFTVE